MPSDTEKLLAELSRRRFLMAGATAFASLSPLPYLYGADKLGTREDQNDQVWQQLIKTLLPNQAEQFPLEAAQVHDKIKRLLACFPKESVEVLDILLPVFDNAAYLISWKFKPFHAMDRKDAVAYAKAWEKGFLWQVKIMKAFKGLIYTAYWSLPESWKSIGYPGPITDRLKIPVLGNAPLPSPLA